MKSHFLRHLPGPASLLLPALLSLSLAATAVPAASTTSTRPALPSKPAKPMNPAKPGRPSLPAKPGKPTVPTRPGKPAKPVASPQPAKPLPRPTPPPRPVALQVEAPVLATAVELAPWQHAVASRVLVGSVACEFGQTVELAAVPQQPGYFSLRIGKATHTLVPQATTTGAVRLEDASGGIVWLQIPTKSMLLDAKLGQRLVDNCQTEAQRSVIVAAGSSLGITVWPPLSDPWAGAVSFAPLPELAFDPLPVWLSPGCCEPEADVPVATAAPAPGSCVVAVVEQLLAAGSDKPAKAAATTPTTPSAAGLAVCERAL